MTDRVREMLLELLSSLVDRVVYQDDYNLRIIYIKEGNVTAEWSIPIDGLTTLGLPAKLLFNGYISNLQNLCRLNDKEKIIEKSVTFSIPNGVPSIIINDELLFKTCHCFGDSSYPKLGLLDNGTEARIVEGLTCNKCSRAWGTK